MREEIYIQSFDNMPCDEVKSLTLSNLPRGAAIDISFQDLNYTIPSGRKKSKIILRSINGEFRSGHLTAILGPSGAGKSSLLNVLAGYRCAGASGTVCTNGAPRDMRHFRKMSRYIMQQDLLQPLLTVREAMLLTADLKLGAGFAYNAKQLLVTDILELLRLSACAHTSTGLLSGGERKRVAIALELVNNPPLLFLDEPTTGLDDVSSAQCMSVLRRVARGGRTVVCCVHTPSARLFAAFDRVYVLARGQCAYQGTPLFLVPHLTRLGLVCPTHYNPADFVIELSSGEYGEHLERLVTAADNGRAVCGDVSGEGVPPKNKAAMALVPPRDVGNSSDYTYEYQSSPWLQFTTLLRRMVVQALRNKRFLFLRLGMQLFLGVIIGSLFLQMGDDASKTIFNFGFCYSCIIALLYVPLLPMLLAFPTEIQLVKREYFNRWYGLKPYYMALVASHAPLTLASSSVFVSVAYLLTGQPLEIMRVAMFFSICYMIALISEALGIVIASTLNIVNSVFTGPAVSVPLMLLAVYGLGTGVGSVPHCWWLVMHLSYLRYGLEGVVGAIYGHDRPDMACPDDIVYCEYKSARYFMKMMGMADVSYAFDMGMLVLTFIAFNGVGYYLLRQRLSPNKTFKAIIHLGRFLKSHLGFSSH